jgi:phage host-nuclease inhibitor protein Gam
MREAVKDARIPAKEKAVMASKFMKKLATAKSVEDASKIIRDYAMRVDKAEVKALQKSVAKRYKNATINATDEDKRFVAAVIKDSWDDYVTDFDVTKLRELDDFMKTVEADGISAFARRKAELEKVSELTESNTAKETGGLKGEKEPDNVIKLRKGVESKTVR